MAKWDHDDLCDKSGSAAAYAAAERARLGINLTSPAEATKLQNPKDGFGTLKACLSWVPEEVIFELAVAMAEGGFKYGGFNYLAAQPRATVYTDACKRHLFQFERLHEETDTESGAGLHHITKAIASLVVLRAAMISGGWIDDRGPPAPAGFLADLGERMKMLAKAFPDPVAKYYAGGRRGPGRILADEAHAAGNYVPHTAPAPEGAGPPPKLRK